MKWLSIVMLLLFPFSLCADAFYAGFAMGFSQTSDNGTSDFETDLGFKLVGGYRVHPNFGIEVAYVDLGKLKNEEPSFATSADTDGINLSVLALIPLSETVDFYGKVGLMSWDATYKRTSGNITTTIKDDGDDVSYGGGVKWTVEGYDNRQYQLIMEYERLHDLGDDFEPGGSGVSILSLAGAIQF